MAYSAAGQHTQHDSPQFETGRAAQAVPSEKAAPGFKNNLGRPAHSSGSEAPKPAHQHVLRFGRAQHARKLFLEAQQDQIAPVGAERGASLFAAAPSCGIRARRLGEPAPGPAGPHLQRGGQRDRTELWRRWRGAGRGSCTASRLQPLPLVARGGFGRGAAC